MFKATKNGVERVGEDRESKWKDLDYIQEMFDTLSGHLTPKDLRYFQEEEVE